MFSKLPVILDGGTGSHLNAAGKPSNMCSEQFIIENPEVLIKLQKAYVDAGSTILMSPTFGANAVALKKYGYYGDIKAICASLVDLSRKASGGKALIAGDIAPTGLMPEPFGDTEEDFLLDVFTEAAGALEEAGVDLFAIETQLVSTEADIALRAVRSVSKKPVMMSFSVTENGRTFFGEKLTDIWDMFKDAGLSAFGVNCIGDPEALCNIIADLRRVCDIPIIAKPNAGLPDSSSGVPVYNFPAETMEKYALKLYESGARLIGGCCGTGPEHIAAVKKALSPFM